MKDAFSIREVAQRLGVAEHTVRRLVRDGIIPSIRISQRRIIIPAAAFEAWLSSKVVTA